MPLRLRASFFSGFLKLMFEEETKKVAVLFLMNKKGYSQKLRGCVEGLWNLDFAVFSTRIKTAGNPGVLKINLRLLKHKALHAFELDHKVEISLNLVNKANVDVLVDHFDTFLVF